MTSEFVTLKSLAHVITKGTTPTKAQGYTDDGINFIRALSIDENGQLDEETFLKISNKTNDDLKRSIVQEGDVLYTIAGVIGRVTVVEKKHLPANLNQALAIIRPKKDKISSRYLANLLRSHDAQFYLKSRVVESVQANLSLGELGHFPVEKLPLAAQNNRNKALELIEDKSRCCSLISDISENLISSLFRSWFIDFDPVKAKAEGKLPYGMDEETAALFPDSFEDSELGPIPTGWRIQCIADVAEVLLGGTPSRDCDNFWGEDGIPWINSGETRNFPINTPSEYITKEGYNNCSTKLVPPRTTVIAITGATLGQISMTSIECCTNQSIVSVVGNKRAPSEFIYPLFNLLSSNLKMLQTGGAQPHINANDIKHFRFVLPPENIIEKYVSKTKDLFDIIDMSAAKTVNLKSTIDALLPRLMSGELKVPMEA